MVAARIRRFTAQLTPFRWVLLAVLALVCVFYIYKAATMFQVDLAVYRDGVRAAWSRGDLYELLFPPVGLPFTYPPFAALIFTPLAVLPLTATQIMWCLITLVCGLVYGVVCVRDYTAARFQSMTFTLIVLIALLVSDPLRIGILFGQINVVLAVLVILDLNGRTGRLPQGVLIGIAAAIKLIPLFLILYFIVTKRFKSAVIAGGTFVVASAIAFACFPQASAQYWGELVLDSTRVGGIAYISNQSLQGMLIRVMGGPDQAKLAWFVCASVLALAMLWVCWRLFATFPAICNALILATMLMASPVSWTHHWILILPLLLVCLTPAIQWASLTLKVIAAVLVVALMGGVIWLVPNTDNQEYHHNLWQFLVGNSYVWLTVLLMIAVAVVGIRARRAIAAAAAAAT
ncbi:MAG: glycosyltransferase 87 family protein [Actinomycetes bacterium]